MIKIQRGNIILVNLDPVIGSEQGKIRPSIVIQNNIGNETSPTTIVAPITSKIFTKEFPTNVHILSRESKLKEDSRIIKKLSVLDSNIMNKVNLAIKVSLDLE